jgi:hypothetical protein
VQNSSARCGGGIAVSGSASLSISNSTLFDNLAFGTLNGTSMGGGLFSIDTRQELAVEPLWAVGSWANPPLLNQMHEETAGPIQVQSYLAISPPSPSFPTPPCLSKFQGSVWDKDGDCVVGMHGTA